MNWVRVSIIGLGVIVLLQSLAVVVTFVFRSSHETTIATFDPDAAINSFVLWSEGKLNDSEFKSLLAEFEHHVDAEIAAFATAHNLIVLRRDAVLSYPHPQIVDITEAVMRGVLE